MNNSTAINSKKSSIIEGLVNESAIAGLLENLCFEDIKKVKIIESYNCNKEHIGLFVEVNNKITDKKERIIIDAVIGYPVTEQVYETVYRKGSNCDKRILIYTKGLAKLDTYGGVDDDVVKNLVANLNGYGTNIFLARLDKGKYKVPLEYTIRAEPPENLKYSLTDLPSEVRLKEVEFWEIYYWQHMECFYRSWETFTGQIHGPIDFGHWFGLGGVDIYAKWTEEGIFFEAKDENEESECLEPIWNTRKFDLQALYPNAEVTFFIKPGKLPKLLIKFLPTSVKFLLDASVSEKKRLANEIFKEFYKFRELIEYALDDIDNAKIDEVREIEQVV